MKKIVSIILVMMVTSLVAQTSVVPGEGTLTTAIAAAADGDVLLLSPGAEYTESTESDFGTISGKTITIEVDGDGTELAVVKMLTQRDTETTPEFFVLEDSAGLILRGIEFDGGMLNESQANTKNFINFFVGETPAETFIKRIEIDNCYIHDLYYDGEVIAAGSSSMKYMLVIDSTFVNNTIMEKTGTPVYYKYGGANYIEVTNSTFWDIKSYGFRITGPAETGLPENTPTVKIDRTTWYNIGTHDGREILLLERGPNLNPWTVTNSIFMKQVEKSKGTINLKETIGDSMATITNCVWFDVGDVSASRWKNHTVSDTMTYDPQFTDPENGDFTLPGFSPLFTYADDGGAIGDPRWLANLSVEETSSLQPSVFSLSQNYPNPFNPSTSISFTLDRSGLTSLVVYDMLGKSVKTLIDGNMGAGTHKVSFHAGNLPSGIYFYHLESGDMTDTRKMMLIK